MPELLNHLAVPVLLPSSGFLTTGGACTADPCPAAPVFLQAQLWVGVLPLRLEGKERALGAVWVGRLAEILGAPQTVLNPVGFGVCGC